MFIKLARSFAEETSAGSLVYFVSLVLKALLVKASSGVLNTEFWFSRNYLLTRVSMYWEFHLQFRSFRDLLSTSILPYFTNG